MAQFVLVEAKQRDILFVLVKPESEEKEKPNGDFTSLTPKLDPILPMESLKF